MDKPLESDFCEFCRKKPEAIRYLSVGNLSGKFLELFCDGISADVAVEDSKGLYGTLGHSILLNFPTFKPVSRLAFD